MLPGTVTYWFLQTRFHYPANKRVESFDLQGLNCFRFIHFQIFERFDSARFEYNEKYRFINFRFVIGCMDFLFFQERKSKKENSIQIFFYMHFDANIVVGMHAAIFLLYLSKINIRHTSIFSCYINFIFIE